MSSESATESKKHVVRARRALFYEDEVQKAHNQQAPQKCCQNEADLGTNNPLNSVIRTARIKANENSALCNVPGKLDRDCEQKEVIQQDDTSQDELTVEKIAHSNTPTLKINNENVSFLVPQLCKLIS